MIVLDMDTNQVHHYSQLLMDSENGISYPEAAPHNFSLTLLKDIAQDAKVLAPSTLLTKVK